MTPDPKPSGEGRYKGPRGPAARDRDQQKKGRLPDGSRYEVRYDATRQRRSGTLNVPILGYKTLTFKGEASGVFWLMAALDQQYRDWRAAATVEGGAS